MSKLKVPTPTVIKAERVTEIPNHVASLTQNYEKNVQKKLKLSLALSLGGTINACQNQKSKNEKEIKRQYIENTGIKNFKLLSGIDLLQIKSVKKKRPRSEDDDMSIANETGSDPGNVTKRKQLNEFEGIKFPFQR